MPSRSKPAFPVSTSEWTPSENIAELSVTAAATNLATAMARLPPIAAYTATFDPDAMNAPLRFPRLGSFLIASFHTC